MRFSILYKFNNRSLMMITCKKIILNVLCVMALLLANTAQAQKAGELLVLKDMKPGKWANSGTVLANGSLLPGSTPEVECLSKDDIDLLQNESTALYRDAGGKASKQCPTVTTTNTPELAITTMRCADDVRMPGMRFGLTNTIKRESTNTWTISATNTEQKGALKVTMKYLGACTNN
jgi:hypothetical protein